MKALRILRNLATNYSVPPKNIIRPIILPSFYSARPEQKEVTPHTSSSEAEIESNSVFDSAYYAVLNISETSCCRTREEQPTWEKKYRERANKLIFGKEIPKGKLRFMEEEEEKRRRVLAKALLGAALETGDNEDEDEDESAVKEEDQKSLSVGIIGAPNAGKSSLTNYMVGMKVSAVSRKTNTTTHEMLGVMTKGNTQICLFDTPGLSGYPYKDVRTRVESAWSSINLYEVLIVIFDVHRHLTRPDKRVIKLIKHLGAQPHPKQKRILCMNKVDLVEKKKQLLKVVEEFKDLPGYERHFLISGLKGAGLKVLTQYLIEQAVKRPWEENPFIMSEEVMKMISLEVVRERLLDYVHQEIPYEVEHRLIDWKELRNGSLRIEQHFFTNKLSQLKILVGKNGSKIGRIGIEANDELRAIFKKEVHLILQVRLKQ